MKDMIRTIKSAALESSPHVGGLGRGKRNGGLMYSSLLKSLTPATGKAAEGGLAVLDEAWKEIKES